jgi:hypothetical protein
MRFIVSAEAFAASLAPLARSGADGASFLVRRRTWLLPNQDCFV